MSVGTYKSGFIFLIWSLSVFYGREVKCMDLGDRMLGLNLGFALTDGLTLKSRPELSELVSFLR